MARNISCSASECASITNKANFPCSKYLFVSQKYWLVHARDLLSAQTQPTLRCILLYNSVSSQWCQVNKGALDLETLQTPRKGVNRLSPGVQAVPGDLCTALAAAADKEHHIRVRLGEPVHVGHICRLHHFHIQQARRHLQPQAPTVTVLYHLISSMIVRSTLPAHRALIQQR